MGLFLVPVNNTVLKKKNQNKEKNIFFFFFFFFLTSYPLKFLKQSYTLSSIHVFEVYFFISAYYNNLKNNK